MENKTAEGIALEFCEIFQNNYPEKPIHRMMVDLAKEIKTYASLQCAEMKEELMDCRNALEREKQYLVKVGTEDAAKIKQLQEEVERLRSIINEVQVYPETEEFHERLFLSAKGRELFKALSGKESKTDNP